MNNDLRGRILALIAEGKTPLEIRRTLHERWPDYTRGQINGLLYRFKAEGMRFAEPAEPGPESKRAQLTPEERKARAEFAASFRGLQGPVGGAGGVEQARKRSAESPWPASGKGDHRPEHLRPKQTLPALAAAVPLPAAPMILRRFECSWVDGQRGAWVLCEDLAEPGIPFCKAHAARGIQPKRKVPDETVDRTMTAP